LVISLLIYGALGGVSSAFYGLFGFSEETYYFSIFQVGIPALASLWFDFFISLIQSFVFLMLTCANVKKARDPA